MYIVEKIANYIVKERDHTLSPLTWHFAKRALIDWFSAMYSGAMLNPNPMLRASFIDPLDPQHSLVFAVQKKTSVKTAAFLNGASAHTSEFDDIFREGGLHPGCATIAAALAIAEHHNVHGEDLLRSIITGYEVCSRLGVAMGRSHYNFWHTTGTVSTFGACAAASLLLKLDQKQTAHALATSATLAAGLQQAFRGTGMSKAIHSAHASETGVMAAIAASNGVTGALDILEGEAGMGAAMSVDVDWNKATENLGNRYNIESITLKNHGCCGHTFAAIDGLLHLMKYKKIVSSEISRIDIYTYEPAIRVTNRINPSTPEECKFSMQYVVAHAAIFGNVRIDAFDKKKIFDPYLRELLKKVHPQIDPQIDSLFPKKRAARVKLTKVSGEVFTHYQPTRKGDPDLPLNDEELEAKFLELSSPLIGEKAAKKMLSLLWCLEMNSISDFLASSSFSETKKP